jgi:hypothetical protein
MRPLSPIPVAVLLILSSVVSVRAGTCENGTFDSTFELIQKAIFENRSCADSLCHGTAKSGGLDLRAGASYDSLVDVPAGSVPGAIRVVAVRRTKASCGSISLPRASRNSGRLRSDQCHSIRSPP